MDDSFRGTCLRCGAPVGGGANIHKDCAQVDLRSVDSFQAANEAANRNPSSFQAARSFSRDNNWTSRPKNQARIPDQMANVQVCERCGSIGQAKDFLSLTAHDMSGGSLVMPRLITTRQFEREQEDAEEEETPQTNFTICRNCKESLRSFLGNAPTESGVAGPIAPRLPNPSQETSNGGSTPTSGTNG